MNVPTYQVFKTYMDPVSPSPLVSSTDDEHGQIERQNSRSNNSFGNKVSLSGHEELVRFSS